MVLPIERVEFARALGLRAFQALGLAGVHQALANAGIKSETG
jgi:hypothetical protein